MNDNNIIDGRNYLLVRAKLVANCYFNDCIEKCYNVFCSRTFYDDKIIGYVISSFVSLEKEEILITCAIPKIGSRQFIIDKILNGQKFLFTTKNFDSFDIKFI